MNQVRLQIEDAMHEMENLLRLCFVSLCQRVALTSASRGVSTQELMQAPGVATPRKVRSITHWQHDQTSKVHQLAALEQHQLTALSDEKAS